MTFFKEFQNILAYSSLQEIKRHGSIAQVLGFFSFFFLFLFGLKAFYDSLILHGVIHFLFLGSSVIFIVLYRILKKSSIISNYINIVFTIFISYLLFTGGNGGHSGLMWFQVCPLVAFTVNNLKTGTLMTLLYIGIAIIGTVFTYLPFVTHNYSEHMIYSFYSVFTFVIMLTFFMEFSRVKANMLESNYKNSLLKISQMDELTNIYNRRYMSNLLKKMALDNKKFSFVFLDIDNFKQINDNYGHDVGDLVIKEIAQTLNSSLRESDFVSRWGGEEFVMIFDNVSKEETIEMTERVRARIENLNLKGEGFEFNVTCSFGIAFTDGYTKEKELIKEADTNLYKAKNTGKNKIVFE